MNEHCLLKIRGSASEESDCLNRLPYIEVHLQEDLRPLKRPTADRAGRLCPINATIIARPRKSGFIRAFDGAAAGLVCNRFFQLILSNGCPFACQYCYLRLTLGRNKGPVVFTNPWPEVERQLEKIAAGVFSTGELADSLAVTPPLLPPAIEYFRRQTDKSLFLTTKSANVDFLLGFPPTPQVWISFSLNAVKTWRLFEKHTPHPYERLAAAWKLKKAGWRVRVRIDPIIPEVGLESYRDVLRQVRVLAPERVTLGVLKHFPKLPRGQRVGPQKQLVESINGINRYSISTKVQVFKTLADWLGWQPALCRETPGLWEALGWKNHGCNCTTGQPGARACPEAPSDSFGLSAKPVVG